MSAAALAGTLLIVAAWRWLPPVACDSLGAAVLGRCDEAARHYATLKRDLEALRDLEEVHLTERWTYTHAAEDLGFIPSDGVEVSIAATGDGWTATATHAALGEGRGCAIYWGRSHDYRPRLMGESDVDAGEIFCTR